MLLRDLRDPRLRGISVTRVKMADDLRHGRVFFSHLEGRTHAGDAVKGFQSASGFIRRAIGRTLAGYPGRKNLIWVSAAFPLSLPSTGASIGGTLLTGLLRETTETLTNARVAIYPIDARGLVATTIFDASRSGTKGLGHVMMGPEFAGSVNQQQATILDPQGTMEDIANWTGGLAFINRNDLGHALEESLADGSSYYALGFYRADQTHDGKFHKLEVRLDRRDCEVRYRHG